MDGGYIEFAIAVVEIIVYLPNNISFEQAAMLTDSLTIAYHAVIGAGEVKARDIVAVVGPRDLGSTALRVACLQGASVYGFDIDPNKFTSALESGATACFTAVNKVSDIKFDIILNFVGISKTIGTALRALRYRGRLVLVGLAEKEITFPLFDVVFDKIEIGGCLGGSKDDMRALFELIASGKLNLLLEEVPFENVNASLHRLEAEQVAGGMFTRPRKGMRARPSSGSFE
jgi:propanol-preferring alcohol dehydrogenase